MTNRYLFYSSAGLIRTDEDAPQSDTSITISKGNNLVDTIYMNIQSYDRTNAYATVTATLPDQTHTSTYEVLLPTAEFTKDGQEFSGFKFIVSNAYTNIAGIETLTFRFKSLTTDNVLATAQLVIMIQDNDTPTDPSITPDQLDELYETIQENYNTLDGKIDDVEEELDARIDVLEEEIDTKLDKDFSSIAEDTSISGNETLVMNDDNGDLKKIKSGLLVNKVESVNNVEPDSNKNITLVAGNITTTDNSTVQNKVNEAVYFEEEEIASLDDENLIYNTITNVSGQYKVITPLKPINQLDTLMFIFEDKTLFVTIKEDDNYGYCDYFDIINNEPLARRFFCSKLNNNIHIYALDMSSSYVTVGKLIKILRVSKRSDN